MSKRVSGNNRDKQCINFKFIKMKDGVNRVESEKKGEGDRGKTLVSFHVNG